MSLKIGGSDSDTSSTSNTQTNSTTTPIVPQWATDLTQNVAGRVGGLLNYDPQSLVAPANNLQTQAANSASNLSGSPWNFDGAADLTRGAANTSWIDGYMNSATPFASSQVSTLAALVIVSMVVKVLLATASSVVAGSQAANAASSAVPSMFDTTCTSTTELIGAKSRASASIASAGPSAEPPMPTWIRCFTSPNAP